MPRIDRLAILVMYLTDRVKDKEFDLGDWICGSVACALGHACLIPEFQEAGFLPSKKPISTVGGKTGGVIYPVYQGKTGLEAAVLFFAITYEQATQLFYPSGYPKGAFASRKDVIAKITQFIETKVAQKKDA